MRTLIIDDDELVLKQLVKVVAAIKPPEGGRMEVVAETDYQKAIAFLEKGDHFDIIVTDMVMGGTNREGLEVLHQLVNKSPVTIVITAYPTIPDCVEAMRAGAWDYLEKNRQDGRDPYDALVETIMSACKARLDRPQQGKPNPDAVWIRDNLDRLTKEYPGEFVAVLDQCVVGHDKDYARLVELFKGKFPLANPTVVSVPSQEETTA
jgi:DNA-binding NtrC family response regulator